MEQKLGETKRITIRKDRYRDIKEGGSRWNTNTSDGNGHKIVKDFPGICF